jgi:hypothetical protein
MIRTTTVATQPITGEITKQPLKPSRGECRVFRRNRGD